MSGRAGEVGAFFEAMDAQRNDAGGSGHRWERTGLPRNLTFSVAKLDRTLHALDGVAHVLRAGFAAQTQGDAQASEALGDNITDKLLVALGELIDRANDSVAAIEVMYPVLIANEARTARDDE